MSCKQAHKSRTENCSILISPLVVVFFVTTVGSSLERRSTLAETYVPYSSMLSEASWPIHSEFNVSIVAFYQSHHISVYEKFMKTINIVDSRYGIFTLTL